MCMDRIDETSSIRKVGQSSWSCDAEDVHNHIHSKVVFHRFIFIQYKYTYK